LVCFNRGKTKRSVLRPYLAPAKINLYCGWGGGEEEQKATLPGKPGLYGDIANLYPVDSPTVADQDDMFITFSIIY